MAAERIVHVSWPLGEKVRTAIYAWLANKEVRYMSVPDTVLLYQGRSGSVIYLEDDLGCEIYVNGESPVFDDIQASTPTVDMSPRSVTPAESRIYRECIVMMNRSGILSTPESREEARRNGTS